MKFIYLSYLLIFCILVTIGYCVSYQYSDTVYLFYSKNIQMPLFTGFLTLGGFLLSLKTFILIKLKEGLYDNKHYVDLVRDKRAINPDYSFYGPLTRLGKFLVLSVISSLFTSFFQITFGWINIDIVAIIGMSMAATTASMIIVAWWYIRCNLNRWFELLEKESKTREQQNNPQG